MVNLTKDQRWALWIDLHSVAYKCAPESAPTAGALFEIWGLLPWRHVKTITDVLHDCSEAERLYRLASAEAMKHSRYASRERYQRDDFEFHEDETSFFDFVAAMHKLIEIQNERRDGANTLAVILGQRVPYYNGLGQLRIYANSMAASVEDSWKQDNDVYERVKDDLILFKDIFERKRKEKLSSSAASQFPKSSGWCGSWQLGQGSFGTASVWVKTDVDLRVIDRVVVKDSYGTKHVGTSADAWNDPELWTQDLADPTRKLPNEIVAMSLLRGREGSENIVRIRGHRLRAKEMFTRIFMEYAPFGDCSDFCVGKEPPESFVWAASEALAIAGLLMAHGELVPNQLHYWRPIIHRDLKPENLLLGLPLESRYRGYPSVKLADFGLSCIIDPHNPPDPDSRRVWGTGNCRAPEHDGHVFDGESSLRAMDERTNVWEVGNTVASLILEEWPTYDFDDEDARLPMIQDDGDPGQSSYHYSSELRNAILSCMNFLPQQRPNFKTLLNHIVVCTGGGWFGELNDKSNGLRDGPRTAKGFYDAKSPVLYDRFAVDKKLKEESNSFGTGVNVGNAEEEFGGVPGDEIRLPRTSQRATAKGGGAGFSGRQSLPVQEGATADTAIRLSS